MNIWCKLRIHNWGGFELVILNKGKKSSYSLRQCVRCGKLQKYTWSTSEFNSGNHKWKTIDNYSKLK